MDMNWDEWFKFPIIVVNREWEELERERKEKVGEEITVDLDYVIGECEVPFWDELLHLYDVFRPSEKSFNRARDGKFNACSVSFKMAGEYTIPWTKAQFKEEYSKFLETIKEEQEIVQIPLSDLPEATQNLIKNKIKKNDRRNDSEGLQGLPLGEDNNS